MYMCFIRLKNGMKFNSKIFASVLNIMKVKVLLKTKQVSIQKIQKKLKSNLKTNIGDKL